MEKCKVCGLPAIESNQYFADQTTNYFCSCYKCGAYSITTHAYADFDSYITTDIQKANLSGWIREHQETRLDSQKLASLSHLRAPSLAKKTNNVLLKFAKYSSTPGKSIVNLMKDATRIVRLREAAKLEECKSLANFKFISSLFASIYSDSYSELMFIINEVLVEEYSYLNKTDDSYKITPKGWSYLDALNKKNEYSNKVFIAMRFTDKLKDYSEKYVEKSLEDIGYDPKRIDQHQHNNIIDDEIIAGIKESKFIIADMTENSHGVYFEAGYAMGYNIPVIYLCEENYFNGDDKVHFDTNHYPFILWNYDKGEQLIKDLTNRIIATIGKYESHI